MHRYKKYFHLRINHYSEYKAVYQYLFLRVHSVMGCIYSDANGLRLLEMQSNFYSLRDVLKISSPVKYALQK